MREAGFSKVVQMGARLAASFNLNEQPSNGVRMSTTETTSLPLNRTKTCGHSTAGNKTCNLRAGHEGICSPHPEVERQGIVLPERVVELRKQLEDLNVQITTLRNEEHRLLHEDAKVVCIGWTLDFKRNGCGAELNVSDLVYIQTHWYTPPSGCTGGDYWNVGEGQFVCPQCGARNRLYERPEVEKLKRYFKSVEDKHGR